MSVVPTLILIEDDEDLAVLIADEVARGGYPTVSATTGAEGVRIAREVARPLVILDHGLPDLRAVEVAALLSEEPAIPFLVVTGEDDMEVVQEMLEHGARDYLVKDRTLFHRLPIVLRRVVADLDREVRLGVAERELRESHDLVRSFLDALPIGVFILGGDGRPAYVNRAAAELYGGGAEEEDTDFSTLVAQAELRREDGSPYPFDELPVMRAMRGEGFYADDLVMTLQGHTRPLEAWAKPIFDKGGDVQYAVSAFSDISARKAAEQQIRALNASLQQKILKRTNELEHAAGALLTTERRAHALFEQTAQPMMLLAPGGRVLDVNRAFRDVVGDWEIVGRPFLELATPPSPLGEVPPPEVLRDLLARCVGAGEEVHFDAVRRGEGGVLLAHRRVHLQRVLDDAGDVELVFLFGVDVTDLERAREELQLAWRMAEAANRAKSEFLANMSHEIRTPMTAILGFAELLAIDEGLTPKQREHARTIEGSGQNLLALLDDILEMSNSEAGRTERRLVAFSPAALLAELERSYRSTAFDARIRLEVAPDVTRAIVRSDPAILRKILIQLVSNAIKFTERGSVTLDATLEEADGLSMLSVSVEDTGPGVPVAELERVFDAFEKAVPSPRTVGGTGLGLTIARRLALHLGGSVELESTLGQGSRFTVWVPVVEVGIGDEVADAEIARPSRPPRLSALDLEALRACVARFDPSLKGELQSALTVGDLSRFEGLLTQVSDEVAAGALARLANDFDYEALASVLAG
jgi:PAS domain S-box-containing protein